ncbi:TetR/AcrR family transcriptional regulator [Oceanobacillus arenosus]|uniref:TetR/AcrR family transcriptional regulator n=1 Tax=Oceanobacillus arenosus TaxID=1229153 RepID=A0A3D8PIW6_9BACI|nr:TetR/AcrR family transcriptional regulator [Oceanobacillus arenosus]RDW15168.1 TetR/AcrR family transcriptional regulator [Oceanobacillus arenosus]
MNRKRMTQEERKQETRKMLLDSAAEIFAQLGFHGASVDKIAEFAGYSKGAVYANFNSKEELFLALLEQKMKRDLDTIHQIMKQQHSIDHFIEKMDYYFDLDRQTNRVWSILNMEFLLYAMRQESVRQKWTAMIEESVGQISGVIEKMMEQENRVSTLSAEEFAWTILSLGNGMAILHYISEGRAPLNLYGKALQSIIKPS